MGKFDDLLLKAKDLARIAGNKTEEVMETTRLRLQASQLKSDIDANYLKLGEIIYELKQAGVENEALINMCIAEIESQLGELAELNLKIDKMKNVVKCPECMGANPVGAQFCAHCGTSIKDQPVTEESAEDAAAVAEAEDIKEEQQ